MKKTYEFSAKLWKDPKANWYFVSLTNKLTNEIKNNHAPRINKYGFVKVQARTGNTKWDSTLFPAKSGNYVLAIKSSVRIKEKIRDGDNLGIKIEVT